MAEITATWSATPSDNHTLNKDDISISSVFGGKIVLYISNQSTKFGIIAADLAYVGGSLSLMITSMSVFGSGWTWLDCRVEGDDIVIECDIDCVFSYRFQPSP